MRCPRCGGLLTLLREPKRMYLLVVPIGRENWETTRCSSCGTSCHRELLGKTGLLQLISKTPDGLSLGTPQLTALSHIPKRFTTAISGPNQVTIHYRYEWWANEKQPVFILTSTSARFKERSCGWRDVSVERRAVVSLTTSHVDKTREYDIDLHTEDALYSVIECVSKTEAAWIGRLFSFWSGKPFYEPGGNYLDPRIPLPAPLEPK